MRVDVQKKVRIIQKSMETIRKSDKTLHTISFPRLAQELNMPLEELTFLVFSTLIAFFTSSLNLNLIVELMYIIETKGIKKIIT